MVSEALRRMRDEAAEAAATSRAAADSITRGYDQIRDHALEAAAATRAANAEMRDAGAAHGLSSGLSEVASAFRAATGGAREAETAARGAGRGLKDTETGAKDAERGVRDMGKAVDAAGHALTDLGVAGGAGESGLKGVVGAADGAATGLSTFMMAGRGAASAVSIFQAAGIGLIPIVIGLAVALSPLIAALVSFTVALGAALLVMTIGLGVIAALGGGMIMLAARTGELQGPLNNLKATWQGVADTLGRQAAPAAAQMLNWLNQFAPVVQNMGSQVISWFTARMPAALNFFGGIINETLGAFQRMGQEVGRVVDFMLAHTHDFQALWGSVLNVVVGAVNGLLENLMRLSSWFFTNLPTFEPIIQATFGFLGTILMNTIQFIGRFGLAAAEMFNNLTAGGGHVNALADALHGLGVPMDAAKNIANALAGAINGIKTVIGGAVGIIKEFGESFIKSFGSGESVKGFGDNLRDIGKALGDLMNTLKPAADALGNLAGTVLSQNFLGAVLKLIPPILEFANALGQKLVPVVQEVARFIEDMYPVLQKIGLAFLAYKVATTAAAIAQWALNAAMDANPIGLIIIAIALLAFGIYELIKHWQQIHEWITKVWNAFKDLGPVKAVIDIFNRIKDTLAPIITRIKDFVAAHKELLAVLLIFTGPIGLLIAAIVLMVKHWQDIKDKLGEVGNFVKGEFLKVWDDVRTRVTSAFDNVKNAVTQKVNDVINWLRANWVSLLPILFLSPLGVIITLIIQHWTQIKQLFQAGWNDVKSLVTNLWNDVKQIWTNLQNDVRTIVTSLWNDEKRGWTSIWNDVKTIATSLWNDVKTVFTNLWNDIKAIVTNLWNDEKTLWTNIWNNVKSIVTNLWNDLKALWTNIWNDIKTIVTNIWNDVRTLHTNMWNDVKSILTNLWNDAKNIWTSIWNDIKSIVTNLWNDVKSLFDSAHTAIQNATQTFHNAVTSAWNKFKDGMGAIGQAIAATIVDNLKKGLNEAIKLVNDFIVGVSKILGAIPGAPNPLKDVSITPLAGGGTAPTSASQIPSGFASGTSAIPARGIGQGFLTQGPTFVRALVGEGAAPEYVIPTETKYRANALQLWQDAGQKLGVLRNAKPDITKIPHESGGEISNVGAVLAYQAGGIPTSGHGGQCLAFVCQTSGIGCGIPAAADAASLCNSNTLKAGDVFVTTEPPFGHAGYVYDASNALDSNFHLDEMINIHPMSDIFGLGPVCYIDPGSPFGGAHPTGGGGAGAAFAAAVQKLADPFLKGMQGIQGWGGLMAGGAAQLIIDGIKSLAPKGTGPGPTGGGDCNSIPALMQQFGWNPAGGVAAAMCIAQHESGCNVNAVGGGANGLFQIQVSAHPEFDPNKLFDATYNVWAASQVYASANGWGPWTTHSLCGVESGGIIPQFCEGGVFGQGCGCSQRGGKIPYHIADTGHLTLQRGLNLVGNYTGAPESLGAGLGGGGVVIQINVDHTMGPADAQALIDAIGPQLARVILPQSGHFIGT